VSQTRTLILASASPRRRELLHKLGLRFEVRAADLLEEQLPGEAPEHYVVRLAREKAQAVSSHYADARAVLGADTTVVLDGEVLNKPRDLLESERMLRALRGREHVVYTGVALALEPEGKVDSIVVGTRVRFRDFDDATLHGYVASREGMDKAGSYGIQELGAALVSAVYGSYSNVVGLPAAETIELLQRAAVLESWP
jgi:septum formation protein